MHFKFQFGYNFRMSVSFGLANRLLHHIEWFLFFFERIWDTFCPAVERICTIIRVLLLLNLWGSRLSIGSLTLIVYSPVHMQHRSGTVRLSLYNISEFPLLLLILWIPITVIISPSSAGYLSPVGCQSPSQSYRQHFTFEVPSRLSDRYTSFDIQYYSPRQQQRVSSINDNCLDI